MSTKAFLALLLGVVVLGGAIGGAFAGGIALGKNQGETETQDTSSGQTGSQLNQAQLDQLRQQIQSGDFSSDQLAEFRQQFQGQLGQGMVGQGGAGRGGLTGTVEKVEGSVVTVNTPQGPLEATISSNTSILGYAEESVEALQAGVQVTVTGQRNEDGTVEATSVVITPEGVGVFPGGALGGGRQKQP